MNEQIFSFLEGEGEMVRLTREFDWSETPVGTPAGWPVSLRTTVSLLLSSPFPMLLWWGRDLVQFYNDACLPILVSNGKHPSALGAEGAGAWPEVWSGIKPLIDGVLGSGKAARSETLLIPVHRNGSLEDVYWTFSCSPARDDAGQVAGVLVTGMETGSQQLAESEAQLRLLRNAVPAMIFSLDSGQRYTAYNQAFMDWFGVSDKEAIGKTVREFIGEEAYSRTKPHLELAYAGRQERYEMPAPTRIDPSRWLSIVYTPHKDDAGQVTGVTVLATDITQIKQAELAIQESERRFQNLMRDASVGMLVLLGEEMHVTIVNAACSKIIGHSVADMLNRPLFEVIPEAAATYLPVLKAVLHTGEPFSIDGAPYSVHSADGQPVSGFVNCVYQPYRDTDGTITGVMAVVHDVTAQVQASREAETARRSLALAMQIGNLGDYRVALPEGLASYSPQLAEWFGLPGNEGYLTEVLSRIHQDDQQSVKDALDRSVSHGADGRHDVTYRVAKPDGGYRFLHSIGQVQRQDGLPAEIIGIIQDVSEQILSRQQLEEKEQSLRNTILQSSVAICIFRGDGFVIEIANKGMLELWGKGSEVVGRPLFDAIPEARDQGYEEIMVNVMRTGTPFSARELPTVLPREGVPQAVYVNFAYEPLRDTDGSISGIMATAIEVTEQVAARKKVEESEAKLRSIISTAPAAISLFVGRDLVIESPNQPFIDIVGKGWGVEGLPLREAMPELMAEGQPFLKILDDVYTTGVPFFSPGSMVKIVQNGVMTHRYYNISYSPVYNAEGEVYAILDVAIDVTEQIEARQEAEKAQAALSDAVELAELATWKIDLENGYINYSPRLQEWLGVAARTRAVDAYPLVHERDRGRVVGALQAALGEGSNGIFDETYTIVHAGTGRQRIVHSNGRAAFDAEGKPVAISGTSQDVTIQQQLQRSLESRVQLSAEELAASNEELQAINEELAESNKQLQHSNDELAQYAYVASHDLQEPLRKIRIFTGILSSNQDLPPASRPTIEKIAGSAERMSLLIQDLLAFSRLLKSDTLIRPVSLNEIIKAVWEDFELLVEEKDATIEIGELPVVEGVSLQMNQLFYNLISNALKFTKEDKRPHIKITCRPVAAEEAGRFIAKPFPFSNYYHITVSDNGIGFEAQYNEQIFEVFKRLHGRDSYAGSGIGLSLCRRIIGNHNGCLYAESVKREGSSFHIILPDRQRDIVSAYDDSPMVAPGLD